MREWVITELGSVIETLKGAAFKSANYVSEGIPIVRVSDFTDNSISQKEMMYYNDQDASFFQAYRLQHWDILIQTVGSWQNNPASIVGKVVKVPKDLEGSLLNQNIVKLICTHLVDNKFLYYRLKDDSFKYYTLSGAQGAANQASITLSSIRKFEFLLPPLPTQRRIASILSAYDDLIENNLKRIKLLEELAQRTYEEWFVKFRVNGVELAVMEETGLPEGWERKKLGEFVKTSSGGTPSRKKEDIYYQNGTIPWVKTQELKNGIIIDTQEKITALGLKESSAKLFPAKTVLLAMYGNTIGQTAFLSIAACTNQACCAFLCEDRSYLSYFLHLFLIFNKNMVLSFRMGAAQENISQEIVRTMEITAPDEFVLKNFGLIMQDVYDQLENLTLQNCLLKQSRDILLPRLMSGELEV
jgi:type I restriction enzyme S subunit